MVGSTGTLMTMRLVRSKLRKREETSSPVNVEAPQPQVVPTEQQHQPVVAYRQTQTAWRFPPLPPQPHIYSAHNHDALVPVDKAGLKGFKKQFSGRFKRLVSRKNEPTPVIPPELKPQLKTIYVY